MNTKLILDFKIYTKLSLLTNGEMLEKYCFDVICLEKDVRFDPPINGSLFYYSPRHRFTILSDDKKKEGDINLNEYFLPSTQCLNTTVSIWFLSDYLRKEFIKKFYKSLISWSNFWEEFRDDQLAKLTIQDGKWILKNGKLFNYNYFNENECW